MKSTITPILIPIKKDRRKTARGLLYQGSSERAQHLPYSLPLYVSLFFIQVNYGQQLTGTSIEYK